MDKHDKVMSVFCYTPNKSVRQKHFKSGKSLGKLKLKNNGHPDIL